MDSTFREDDASSSREVSRANKENQMNKEQILRQLGKDLFDIVKKYHSQLSTAELIGALELHKQETIWYHFEQVKQEMLTKLGGKHD